jgi:hypothetical protein
MASHLHRSVTNVQRGLTWLVTAGLAVLLPRAGSQPQLYALTDAGLARLRAGG